MHFSRHQKQHFKHLRKNLATLFWAPMWDNAEITFHLRISNNCIHAYFPSCAINCILCSYRWICFLYSVYKWSVLHLSVMHVQQHISQSIHVCLTFQFLVQVLQNDPDHLDDGQDEGAKSQRAGVVPVWKSVSGQLSWHFSWPHPLAAQRWRWPECELLMTLQSVTLNMISSCFIDGCAFLEWPHLISLWILRISQTKGLPSRPNEQQHSSLHTVPWQPEQQVRLLWDLHSWFSVWLVICPQTWGEGTSLTLGRD